MNQNNNDVDTLVSRCIAWCGKHLTILKGLAALTFGLILIFITIKIIVNMIVFLVGAAFIYHGLVVLKITQITDIIDRFFGKNRPAQSAQPMRRTRPVKKSDSSNIFDSDDNTGLK